MSYVKDKVSYISNIIGEVRTFNIDKWQIKTNESEGNFHVTFFSPMI